MKIVYISPHLSTGGCPQFLLKKIQNLHKDHEIYCIEYSDHGSFTVQKNQIKEILGKNFFSVNYDHPELLKIVDRVNPDVVHLEEMPEYFMDDDIAIKLYRKDRKYKLIETSHDSSFDPKNKKFFPDRFIFVSKFQEENMKVLGIPSEVCEYPISIIPRKSREEALEALGLDPKLKHVINVGLFTPRKNQAEIVEYAKELVGLPIQFHFIGNQADNFKFYWEPIMKNFPSNCKWWNERKDVDNFYQAADLFLFTSRGTVHDKETSPLVIREAISYNIPSLIYNLPVYLGMYDKYDNIKYLDFESNSNNLNKILKALNMQTRENKFYTMKGEEDLPSYKYPNSTQETLTKYGDGAAIYWATFLHKELERFDVKVEKGDVFVDLGTNIGLSSRYAYEQGASEIYCFEPDPNLVKIIAKNVPSAKVFQNAIDKDVKEIELYHWPHNPVNVGPKYEVSTVTIKDVIDLVGKPIDYLKVDIEGFEETAFDSLTNEDFSKIKKMFIEHHDQTKTELFCNKLRSKGWNVNIEQGSGQSYIYATKIKIDMNGYPFSARWDWNEQKMLYSCAKNIGFPVTIALREYKSEAVLWSVDYPSFPSNCEFWMIPIPKTSCDYSTYEYISGIKFCVYKTDTQEQIYEQPFYNKFVNLPTISLSNKAPYYLNYLEYFVFGKYSRWIRAGKKFHTTVDVGANIGVFTEFLIRNKISKKITSVECDVDALKDLQRNYELNDNVTVIPKALSATNDPITFYHCPENSVISSTIPPSNVAHHRAGLIGSQQITVDAITLKDLVDRLGHIDLLKIDIEGAEYNIFDKLDFSLSSYIDNMFIECHFFEADYKEKYARLKDKIAAMGYTIEEAINKPIEDYVGSSECIFATKL